jgi:small-conductance mechanosensitive channel
VVSVVFGLAAQSTLSNVVAGFSLVLYRPIRVGDYIQLNTPKGLLTATVKQISLGYTILLDADKDNIFVPNSLMMSTIVIRKSKSGGTLSPSG